MDIIFDTSSENIILVRLYRLCWDDLRLFPFIILVFNEISLSGGVSRFSFLLFSFL
jgi:hypothetical protein